MIKTRHSPWFTMLSIVLSFIFCSCHQTNAEFTDLPNQEWSQENQLKFTIVPQELTLETPQLLLRHTSDYPFQNIWLKIAVVTKDEENPQFERVQYQLADKAGRFLGKKSGSLFTTNLPLQTFSCPTDTCQLIVQQNMRANPLVGIQAVGVQ